MLLFYDHLLQSPWLLFQIVPADGIDALMKACYSDSYDRLEAYVKVSCMSATWLGGDRCMQQLLCSYMYSTGSQWVPQRIEVYKM